MLRYTPKTEKEINDSRLLPEGEYDFEIYKADDSKPTKKTGDPMLSLTLKVFTDDGASLLVNDWIVLTDQFAWKLRGLCAEVGLLDAYEAGTLDNADFVGAAGKVVIGIGKRTDNGEDQNTVKRYGPKNKRKEAPAPAPKVATEPVDNSDVPF